MAFKKKGLLAALLSLTTGYCTIVWIATLTVTRHNDTSFDRIGALPMTRKTAPRCAICFFGLPRSFKDLVLASLVENVFIPNAKYDCDFFVHYFHREKEPEGRAGKGGAIDPDEVLLMADKIKEVAAASHSRVPTVVIAKDTDEDFWKRRGKLVEKYRTTKATDGNYLYYPWKAVTYHYPESIDNIARQWHSIESAWEAMTKTTKRDQKPNYSRVAMLRLDVLYAFPVDIFRTDKNTLDLENAVAVAPGFAKYPVNDRMFYGPYEAVRIWATERFKRIEQHALTYEPGWGMHSEKFLDHGIFTAIREEAKIPIKENPDLCCMRVRADKSVRFNDCYTLAGSTRGIKKINRKKLVEDITGAKCIKTKLKQQFQLECTLPASST